MVTEKQYLKALTIVRAYSKQLEDEIANVSGVQVIKDAYLIDCGYDFNPRTIVCLKSAGITTVYQLLDSSREFIKKIRNLGYKTLHEIDDFLESSNLALKPHQTVK